MPHADNLQDLPGSLRLPEPRGSLCRCVHHRLHHRHLLPAARVRGAPALPKDPRPSKSTLPLRPWRSPFGTTEIVTQYPENSPYAGYVTTYLTPLSQYLADHTHHLGTTIVAHPGGIIDEILYNTRGLDTVVETSILFTAFAIASYLYRRREEE